MATEEFKKVTKELLDNYLELRKIMQKHDAANISFSFKEYLDHYIKYVDTIGLDDDIGLDDEDYNDEDYNEED